MYSPILALGEGGPPPSCGENEAETSEWEREGNLHGSLIQSDDYDT